MRRRRRIQLSVLTRATIRVYSHVPGGGGGGGGGGGEEEEEEEEEERDDKRETP